MTLLQNKLREHIHHNAQQQQQFISQIEEDIRCPACFIIPTSGPIHCCPKGNFICSKCFSGIGSPCPSRTEVERPSGCLSTTSVPSAFAGLPGTPYTTPDLLRQYHELQRVAHGRMFMNASPACAAIMVANPSQLAMHIINFIERACKNDGCFKKVSLPNMEEHKKVCNFRLIKCPSYQCREQVPHSLLPMHVDSQCSFSSSRNFENCQASVVYQDSTNTITTSHCDLTVFIWNQRHFLLTNRPGPRRRIIYVQTMGTDEDRRKYRVTISIASAAEENQVSTTEMPLSLDIAEDDPFRGLILSDEKVNNISTQKCGSHESEYIVSLTLKKLE